MSSSAKSTIFVCGMTWLFLLANVCLGQQSRHQKQILQKAADRPPIKLPGITVDFKKNVVDIEATVGPETIIVHVLTPGFVAVPEVAEVVDGDGVTIQIYMAIY